MRSRSRDKSGELRAIVQWFVAAALMIVVVLTDALRMADELRPHVGDIIAFVPGRPAASAMQSPIAVVPIGTPPESPCVLEPRVMRALGGSLVIEAARPGDGPGYRVHWAGVRTSDSRSDCGATADLLLTPEEIAALSVAAGGQH